MSTGQQKQPDHPQIGPDFEAFVGLVFTALATHHACISPFTRCRSGKNWPGVCGLYAFGLLYLMAIQSRAFLYYLAAWFAMLVYRRIESFIARWKGWRIHGNDSGYPWLTRHMGIGRAVIMGEVLPCLVIGVCLMPVSGLLAKFICLAPVTYG